MFDLIWEENQYCLTWKKLKALCYESAIKHDQNALKISVSTHHILGLNVTLWIFGPHCEFPWRQNQPLPTSTVNYCPFLILLFFHFFLQIFPSAEARRRVSLITNRLHFTNCIKVDKMTRYDLNKVYEWLFPKIYKMYFLLNAKLWLLGWCNECSNQNFKDAIIYCR